MENSVEPDQMLQNAASDLGLHFAQACLSQYLGLLQYILNYETWDGLSEAMSHHLLLPQ